MKRSGMTNTLRRLVRRWWAGVIYLIGCAAWLVWCCHDSLAGMFWPALAVASFPVALACAPWPPNTRIADTGVANAIKANAGGQPRLAETKKGV